MVLGEPQILGQMKDAVRAANDAGARGSTRHQRFQRSLAVAQEVRTSTAVGEHSNSVAAAAVRVRDVAARGSANTPCTAVAWGRSGAPGRAELAGVLRSFFPARVPA